MKKKKVVIIDNEPLIPTLIKELIEEEEEFEITGIATDKETFLRLVRQQAFDAALVDLSLEEKEGGIDLLRILKAEGINLPVVILSAHDEQSYAFRCLTAGAVGYINKIHVCTDLIDGLKQVLKGGYYVSGKEAANILKKYAEHRSSLKVG